MQVVIFGATGGTGRHLVTMARAAGHTVTVLARDPAKCAGLAGVTVLQGDVRVLADVKRAVVGQDAVLSAIGGESLKRDDLLDCASRNMISAMTDAHIKRIVVLGAAGALHDALKYQTWHRKVVYRVLIRTMLKFPLLDSAAQERNLEASALDYTVVHPPRLLDTPALGNFREMADGLPPKSESISREDVAAFMVRVLDDSAYYRTGPYISQ